MLPRPDINALGIKYRRIPLLAHGRNVYCDTRLILRRLETLFPSHHRLGASVPEQKGIERLLSSFTIDGCIFALAARLIPPSAPLLNDPKFLKDRAEFTGRNWSVEGQQKRRPEALVQIRQAFELLETTLLADGRDWILKTDSPSLADIEAVWPFHWLNAVPDAIPDSTPSAKTFPRVFSWIERFDSAVKAARDKTGKAMELKGPAAIRHITDAAFMETELVVNEDDETGLRRDEMVEVYPLDSGFAHKDRGRLVKLTKDEVAIAVTAENGREIRVHSPRWGFRVQRSAEVSAL